MLRLSFGGLRETHSSFFGLDGTDYSVSLSGVQRTSPSLDWCKSSGLLTVPIRVTTDVIWGQWSIPLQSQEQMTCTVRSTSTSAITSLTQRIRFPFQASTLCE